MKMKMKMKTKTRKNLLLPSVRRSISGVSIDTSMRRRVQAEDPEKKREDQKKQHDRSHLDPPLRESESRSSQEAPGGGVQPHKHPRSQDAQHATPFHPLSSPSSSPLVSSPFFLPNDNNKHSKLQITIDRTTNSTELLQHQSFDRQELSKLSSCFFLLL